MSDPPPRELPGWAPAAAVAAALAALVAASFHERWEMLASSPFPVGVDGYYYPIQLRALLETGWLQYPAAPVAFLLMAPFAAATDPVTGAKLAAAFYGALVALPAYGLGARLGGARAAGLVAAAIAARSAGSAYLTLEFVKNGIGLTIALAALWLLLRALEVPSRGRIAGALLAIAAAAGTHKMALGVAAVVAVPAVLAAAVARGILRGRRLVYAVAGLAIAGAAAAAVAIARSPELAALLDGLVTADARWNAPAHAGKAGREITLGHEALKGAVVAILAGLALTGPGGRAIAAPIRAIAAAIRAIAAPIRAIAAPIRAIAAAIRAIIPREHVAATSAAAAPADTAARSPADAPARSPADTAARLAVLGLALALALPWLDVSDPQGLGFRLRIAAFVPLALAAAILAGRLVAWILPPGRDLALAALAVGLTLHTPGSREEGRVVTHPALVTSVQAMAGKVPAGDIVIMPERHIAYMLAWYLRASVSLGPDQWPADRRWRAMPLAWIGAGSPLDRALLAARDRPGGSPPLGLHPSHPNGMVLVTEAVWQEIAASLPPGSPWPSWPTR